MAVAIGIDGVRHALIHFAAGEQLVGIADDIVAVNAGELDRAGRNGLGALGLAAQNEDGPAQRGRLLLNAAGVGHDHVACAHEPVHIHRVERLDEVYVRQIRKVLACRAAHDGRQMHGIDDLNIGVRQRNGAHGGKNILHRLAVVFAAVAGHCNDAL